MSSPVALMSMRQRHPSESCWNYCLSGPTACRQIRYLDEELDFENRYTVDCPQDWQVATYFVPTQQNDSVFLYYYIKF